MSCDGHELCVVSVSWCLVMGELCGECELVSCDGCELCVVSVSWCLVLSDLTLSFMNPRLLDDVSFHPCIRYKRWEVSAHTLFIYHMIRVTYIVLCIIHELLSHSFQSERVLSFIPPDGPFKLLSYQIGSQWYTYGTQPSFLLSYLASLPFSLSLYSPPHTHCSLSLP